MALEAAFEKLCTDLRQFRDRVSELETTVTEDRPHDEGVILVDEVSDAITDVESNCRECLDAAEAALCAVHESSDAHRLRRSLAASHSRFHAISSVVVSNLLAYEKISALVGFGRKHGYGWEAWVRAVRMGSEALWQASAGIAADYLACWEALAERSGASPVAIHNTSIGQNISPATLDAKAVAAGIT